MLSPDLAYDQRRKMMDLHAAEFHQLERAATPACPRLTKEDRSTIGKPDRQSCHQEERRSQQQKDAAAGNVNQTSAHVVLPARLPPRAPREQSRGALPPPTRRA